MPILADWILVRDIFLKIMKKILSLIGLSVLLTSCTDENGARKTLERNNYKVLEVGGHRFLRLNKSTYATEFKAIAPNGETVTGYVTGDLFDGNVIRFDN